MEVWKDIEGYEGLYQVSDLGRVKSLPRKGTRTKKEYILKQSTYRTGYKYIILSKNNISKKAKIHRLVAKTFIPNPNNYPCVNHIDEDKDNNKVQNLEWCTFAYNNQYSKSKKVKQFDKQGNLLKIWNSTREIERELGISHSYISSYCRNKKGEEWRYMSAD